MSTQTLAQTGEAQEPIGVVRGRASTETRNRSYGLTGARAALSLIFILSGLGKIAGWSGTAAFMESKGMPLVPFFLTGAILLEVLGGLSVLTGYKIRWGTVLLIFFLIPATLIFHNFWALEGMAQQTEMIQFLKNLSIMGGLFYINQREARRI